PLGTLPERHRREALGRWRAGAEEGAGILDPLTQPRERWRMTQQVAENWQAAFWRTAQQHEYASLLRDAALRGRLGDWTKTLTSVTVSTCRALGWQASAKDHHLDLLPVPHYEYLTLDVMAFAGGEKRWRFPVAVAELENSADNDRIAYSLWKVLCVRS